MSQKLLDMMQSKIDAEGTNGRLKLALSINRTERVITNYIRGENRPRAEQAYALAKECGATEEVAREIEREYLNRPAKETA